MTRSTLFRLRVAAALACLALCTAPLHAQAATGTIEGRVFNPETGAYVERVRLTIAPATGVPEPDSETVPDTPVGAGAAGVRHLGCAARDIGESAAARDEPDADLDQDRDPDHDHDPDRNPDHDHNSDHDRNPDL